MFKISNLVLGGKEIVTSLYSSLGKTEREIVYGAYSELAGSPFISVKLNGLGNFLEQLTLYTSTAFDHLKSCGDGYHVSHTCHSENPVRHVKEFTRVTTLETTLPKWEPLEVKIKNFDFWTY